MHAHEPSGCGQNAPEGAHEADDADGHRDGAEGDEGHGDDEEVEHAPESGERVGGGRSERDGNLGKVMEYSRGLGQGLRAVGVEVGFRRVERRTIERAKRSVREDLQSTGKKPKNESPRAGSSAG